MPPAIHAAGFLPKAQVCLISPNQITHKASAVLLTRKNSRIFVPMAHRRIFLGIAVPPKVLLYCCCAPHLR